MSMSLNERNPNLDEIHIGTQSATITLPGKYFRKHSKIKNVYYLDQAGIPADNTNFLQISLQDLSAVEYAKLDTRAANDGAVVANTAKPMALSVQSDDSQAAISAEEDVPAGTNLRLVITKNGTGVPTLAKLLIEWYPL